MPIAPLVDPNELRSSVLGLAGVVDDCLAGKRQPERYVSTINGMFRLLEAYRSLGSDALRRRTVSSGVPFGTGLTEVDDPRGAEEVAVALEGAFHDAFGDRPREGAHSTMVATLRQLAGYALVEAADIEAARAFLRSLVSRLSRLEASLGDRSGRLTQSV